LTAAQADAIRTLLSPQSEQSLYFTTMAYGAPYALFTEQAVPSLTDKALLVVSGIAHPVPLLHHLSIQGAQIKALNYPDHHRFSQLDARHINRAFEDLSGKEKWVITTEKDAARLRHLRGLSDGIRNHLLVQPITVRFLLEQEQAFAQDLHKRLRNVRPATKH
jgi:tetraacyldisaccharide-1-P 4'-kinase